MNFHDRDKAVALLKSLAAPCDTGRKPEHSWRKCRHCLAVAECEHPDVRALLAAFVAYFTGSPLPGETSK